MYNTALRPRTKFDPSVTRVSSLAPCITSSSFMNCPVSYLVEKKIHSTLYKQRCHVPLTLSVVHKISCTSVSQN